MPVQKTPPLLAADLRESPTYPIPHLPTPWAQRGRGVGGVSSEMGAGRRQTTNEPAEYLLPAKFKTELFLRCEARSRHL